MGFFIQSCTLFILVLCASHVHIVFGGGGNSISIVSEDDLSVSNATCVPCPVGTFSNDHKGENCTLYCDPGFCPSEQNCTLCAPGTYNDQENATSCERCPTGMISIWGATNCSSCDPGWTNNTNGAMCVQCTAGTFNPNEGGKCEKCGPGKFSNPGAIYCLECPKGSYNPDEGRGACYPCGPGKYNPEMGQLDSSACLVCPTGYYCPFPMTDAPVACPADYYCTAGSSLPKSCPLLFESERTAESCYPEASLYLIMLGSIALLVICISVVVCVRASSKKKEKLSKKGPTERDKLIPPPLDGPVYSGL